MATITTVLFGGSGNGKSALANVMNKTNLFNESSSAAAGTAQPILHESMVAGFRMRTIDTVGFGDAERSQQEVLMMAADAIRLAGPAIHQIFYVVSGRFRAEDKAALLMLRDFLLGEGIHIFLTIVRTNFANFTDAGACAAGDEEICRLCPYPPAKVIHIDNPNSFNRPDWEAVRQQSFERIFTWLQTRTTPFVPDSYDKLVARMQKMQTIEAERREALEREATLRRQAEEAQREREQQEREAEALRKAREEKERELAAEKEKLRQQREAEQRAADAAWHAANSESNDCIVL